MDAAFNEIEHLVICLIMAVGGIYIAINYFKK